MDRGVTSFEKRYGALKQYRKTPRSRLLAAVHPKTRKRRVLRLFDRDYFNLVSSPEFLDRAMIKLKLLKHQNLVPINDHGITRKGKPYLILDFVKGKSLRLLLEENGSLDSREALTILLPLLDGLIAAHNVGLVHSNLHPGNIKVGASRALEQRITVLDIGFCVRIGAFGKIGGDELFFPQYLSPEQLQPDLPVTGASDVYTLGLCMFEMLTGNHPFWGTTPEEVLFTQLYEPPPTLDAFNPDLRFPEGLAAAVEGCLLPDPAERTSLKSLRSQLEQIAESLRLERLKDAPPGTLPVSVGGAHRRPKPPPIPVPPPIPTHRIDSEELDALERALAEVLPPAKSEPAPRVELDALERAIRPAASQPPQSEVGPAEGSRPAPLPRRRSDASGASELPRKEPPAEPKKESSAAAPLPRRRDPAPPATDGAAALTSERPAASSATSAATAAAPKRRAESVSSMIPLRSKHEEATEQPRAPAAAPPPAPVVPALAEIPDAAPERVAQPAASAAKQVTDPAPSVDSDTLDEFEQASAASVSADHDPAQGQLVRDIINDLSTLYQLLMAGTSSGSDFQAAMDDLFLQITHYFAHRDRLDLYLDPFSITYQGRTIYQESQIETNFSYLLFYDGVREISFLAGLTLDELWRFVQVFEARLVPNRQLLDDSVTLLWESDLPHIRLRTLDCFFTYPLPSRERIGELAFPGPLDSESTAPRITEAITVAPVSDAEQRTFRSWVDTELNRNVVDDFVPILHPLLEEKQTIEMSEVFAVFQRLVEYLLGTGDFAYTKQVLTLLEQRIKPQDEEAQAGWRLLRDNMLTPEVAQRMLSVLEHATEPRRAEIGELLKYLTENSIPHLLPALDRLSSSAGWKILRPELIRLGSLRVSMFHNALQHSSPRVVRYVVQVLGQIRDRDTMRYLVMKGSHADPLVRAEVLRAIISLEPPNKPHFLGSALHDESERVRGTALELLRNEDALFSVPVLLEVIKDGRLEQWTALEQQLTYETLATFDSAECYNELKKMLGSPLEQTRNRAEQCLRAMKTTAAKRMLKRHRLE